MPSNDETAERLARIEAGMQALLEQSAHIPRLSENIALMQERDSQHSKRIDILFEKSSETSAAVKAVDAKVDRWINRGTGAYAASTVLFVVIGVLLLRVIGNYEGIVTNTSDMVVTLDRRLSWVEFELRGRVSVEKRGGNEPVR